MHGENRRNLWICMTLLALNLTFIWGNSMMTGEQSSEISSGVLQWITEILGGMIPKGELVLRKLAHFSEFSCLGLVLCWLFLLLNQQGIHRFSMPLLCGMLAALTDETIQVLTPARGPSVIDVWIDTSGVLFGILLMLAGHHLYVSRKRKTIGGNKT